MIEPLPKDKQEILINIFERSNQLESKKFFLSLSEQDRNNPKTLRDTYIILKDIAEKKPQLAGDIYAVVDTFLESKNNDRESYKCAYHTLGTLLEVSPVLAKDIFHTTSRTLKEEKNDGDARKIGYDIKNKIQINSDGSYKVYDKDGNTLKYFDKDGHEKKKFPFSKCLNFKTLIFSGNKGHNK